MRKISAAEIGQLLAFLVSSASSDVAAALLAPPRPIRAVGHVAARDAAPHHCSICDEAIAQLRPTLSPVWQPHRQRAAGLPFDFSQPLRTRGGTPARSLPAKPMSGCLSTTGIRPSWWDPLPSCSLGPPTWTLSGRRYEQHLLSRVSTRQPRSALEVPQHPPR